jgi:hypothetical protein
MSKPIDWDQVEAALQQPTTPVAEIGRELLPVLARQNALARPLMSEGLSNLYAVTEAWEFQMLSQEMDIARINSYTALAAAMQQPGNAALLFDSSIPINTEALELLMRYSPAVKTIFWYRASNG